LEKSYRSADTPFDNLLHILHLSQKRRPAGPLPLGLSGKSQEWIKSYLGDREQYVEIRTTGSKVVISSNKVILSGVPQGSVRGPLLFSMYQTSFPAEQTL